LTKVHCFVLGMAFMALIIAAKGTTSAMPYLDRPSNGAVGAIVGAMVAVGIAAIVRNRSTKK
jgi:hypothetical protein